MYASHANQQSAPPIEPLLPREASSAAAGAPSRSHGLAGHALYLDIDGTILDIAQSPETVEVPDWMVPLLRRLGAKLDGALAFVSGRTLSSIDALFAPLQLPAIAVHGGEIRGYEQHVILDEPLAQALQLALPPLRAALARLPGVRLEDKRCVVALHYRSVPERGREVLKVAELALRSLGPQFGVLMGKCVVEIRPRHLTKGAALTVLMEQAPFRGRTPIFAGDDNTDEDAFAVVNRAGGISVRVGAPAASAATYRLSDPDELCGWLRDIS
jgi:trehalose 6-phosphate phosphatase